MLQVRRVVTPIGVTLRAAAGEIADRLGAADPGLARLLLATRGTLSVFLVAAAAILCARAIGVSPVDFAGGITFSLMGPFLAREPTRAQRQRTLLVLLAPAAVAMAATALLHGQGPAGDALFLALVFLCFLLHPRNPRMIGIGLVAVVQTYVGLFLELPPRTLPLQLLSLLGALPIVMFACFVAVPMRPDATLRRAIRAVQWRAARVLRDAPDAGNGVRSGRLGRHLARLNEAALAADDQLALLDQTGRAAVRTGLIGLELAAARALAALRADQPGPGHDKRRALRLLLHARRMRQGRPYAMDPAHPAPGSLRAALVELGHAVHRLGVVSAELRPLAVPAPPPALPPGPLGWRIAARVTLASALAMAAGMALSPQRWFWAVMTVYVVFLNARSRGDTILRGTQRLAGTLFGIASGLVLAMLASGQGLVEAACMLLSVFGMYYLFLVSYAAGIFCVTVLLGLLYGILGAPLETILTLRLEETAIGAAAAMLVAAFVLPTRTRDQVAASGRNLLAALCEAVRSCRQAWAGASPTLPIEAMRRVDKQVADLRLALAPLTARRAVLRQSSVERPVPALLDCVHWMRELAAASHPIPPSPALTQLDRHAADIEARLAALPHPARRQGGLQEPLPDESPLAGLGMALAQLDQSVELLALKLRVDALEGYGVDS